MSVPVSDTLEFLLGGWSLQRVIEQPGASRVTFTGQGTFTPSPEGATYLETGQVSTGEHTGPARRALLLRPRPAGGVCLLFADARPFIDLDLRTGRAEAHHPCRADLYELRFEVRSPAELIESWRVHGPEKNYSADTVWRRS